MNFQNVAIECETWQQMQDLARIAEGMGYSGLIDESAFNNTKGSIYFVVFTSHWATFTNMCIPHVSRTIIPYTQFINQSDTPSVYGC